MGEEVKKSKIAEIVEKIEEQGLGYKEGAELFGIKPRAVYDYNRRKKNKAKKQQQENKEQATANKSVNKTEMNKISSNQETEKPSKISLPELPEGIKEIILQYRKDNPDHGYKRIEEHLKKRHFVVIPRKKIRDYLKSCGLGKTLDSSFDRKDKESPKKGTRRFEAAYPRELYQMDVTYVYITGISVLYLVMIIDDFSRFCIASALMYDQKGTTMIAVLHQAIERYGKPRKLLTDQGRSFYTWSHESTMFQKYLDDMGIEHIVSDPHSPQTLGKTERLHQTVQREVLRKKKFNNYEDAKRGIEDYIHSYNYSRPHQGINGSFPSDRFHGIGGETARIEKDLLSRSLDFSKGYLIFKNQDQTISVVGSSNGLQVFIDGKLLSGVKNHAEY